MKKLIVALVLTVVLVSGLLIFKTTTAFNKIDLLQSLLIFLLVGFGWLTAFRRLSSLKKGEPVEDELSRSILQKSAALSYYVSLYLWLAIAYFSGKFRLTTEQLLGYGIIGMALIFVGCWSFLKIKGLKNE
jgi:peptidoglycan/LPS O-acetylase OafA/YrhL